MLCKLGDLLARREHGADVGRAVRIGRCAHGEEVGVGRVVRRCDLRVEVQAARALVALDQIAQSRLVDRDDAVAQLPHAVWIDVDAEHVVAELGQAGAGDEADVADPEGDETHGAYLVFRGEKAIMSGPGGDLGCGAGSPIRARFRECACLPRQRSRSGLPALSSRPIPMTERIAILGLGYVGLPVALAFARKFPDVVGFDIHAEKVAELQRGFDRNHEQSADVLKATKLRMTSNPADLKDRTFIVIAVPTPVDANNVPDLTPVERASVTAGRSLARGAIVVYESTVYPGVTEDICGPILERESGLKRGVDFKLGYSPERINPGDKEHTLEKITKVVSGEDADTLERVAAAYGAIIDAGVHRASSIKVAEAAKVIENTQRDLNIALMNELAIIFDRIGIDTRRGARRPPARSGTS